MSLCTPLTNAADARTFITQYLQPPLFDLSEGSYPFPSNYITFALTGSAEAMLPPWAMQKMCSYDSFLGTPDAPGLQDDFGIQILPTEGSTPEDVKFAVRIGSVTVYVDWDATSSNGYSIDDVRSSGALQLARAAAQSVQIWYNVSGDAGSCIDWSESAPNQNNKKSAMKTSHQKMAARASSMASHRTMGHHPISHVESENSTTADNVCTASTIDVGMAWNVLTCNEGINLVNWQAQGVGNDLYWPPNMKQGYTRESVVRGSMAYCTALPAVSGLYGSPTKADEWAMWVDTAYGSTRALQYATNIVFSNGNLDPWQPAGVPITSAGTASANDPSLSHVAVLEASVESLQKTADFSAVTSIVIDMGGHHLDLFWPDENDPDSVK